MQHTSVSIKTLLIYYQMIHLTCAKNIKHNSQGAVLVLHLYIKRQKTSSRVDSSVHELALPQGPGLDLVIIHLYEAHSLSASTRLPVSHNNKSVEQRGPLSPFT